MLGEEGEELDALVQALFAQKSTNSQEIDFCRYEAVEGLNSHFELKANIRPRKEFFVKFYHEMKRANSEISDAKETIEEINKKNLQLIARPEGKQIWLQVRAMF